MADPIIGAGLGALARLAPEMLNFFDRKNARKHELALGEQQAELIKLQGHTKLEEVRTAGEVAQAAAAIEALRESIKAQALPTGIKWVDALSASVRPVWTYLVLLTWASVKHINVGMSIVQDRPWTEIQALLWTADDATMLSTLATFWFLDRVIRKSSARD